MCGLQHVCREGPQSGPQRTHLPKSYQHHQLQVHSLGRASRARTSDQQRPIPRFFRSRHCCLKWYVQSCLRNWVPANPFYSLQQDRSTSSYHRFQRSYRARRRHQRASRCPRATTPTWATSTSPSARAKATLLPPAPLHAQPRQPTTRVTLQQTASS